MGSRHKWMMLADDGSAAGCVLRCLTGVVCIRVGRSATESIAEVTEHHHYIELAFPVLLFILEAGGFRERFRRSA
jgi:hypothetical protein